jgi:hypothetical protein
MIPSAIAGAYPNRYGSLGWADNLGHGTDLIYWDEVGNLQNIADVGAVTAHLSNQLTSTLATGTSPFAVASTTVNTNLNADLLDGWHGTYFGSYNADTLGDYLYWGDVEYTRESLLVSQPIHVPNYLTPGGSPTQSGYPFLGYGQVLTFPSHAGLFPAQLAFGTGDNGYFFYRCAHKTDATFTFDETAWTRIYSATDLTNHTLDLDLLTLKISGTLTASQQIYANLIYPSPATTATGLRANLNGGVGGAYTAGYSDNAWFSHNQEYVAATGHTARHTHAQLLDMASTGFYFYHDTGLTPDSGYTPTLRASILEAGMTVYGNGTFIIGAGALAVKYDNTYYMNVEENSVDVYGAGNPFLVKLAGATKLSVGTASCLLDDTLLVNGTVTASGAVLVRHENANWWDQFSVVGGIDASANTYRIAIGYQLSEDTGYIQCVHDAVGYTPLKINKDGGYVVIGNANPDENLTVAGKVRTNTGFNVNGSDGATGSFTTADSKTVTVTNGIITAIV